MRLHANTFMHALACICLFLCGQKTFEIEAEGELNISPEEEARQLEQFLTFIKMRKAVELEEIAAEFGLKTKVI